MSVSAASMAGSASADMVSAASAPATAASAAAFPLNMSLYHILPNQVIPAVLHHRLSAHHISVDRNRLTRSVFPQM